jgi:hypothetical protein
MADVKELLPDVLAVLPPEDSFEFEMNFTKDKLVCWAADGHYDIMLPPGSYEIIGPVLSLSEEQAAQVVQSMNPFITGKVYKDYQTGYFESATALESLSSLLKSKGLAGNYLLIRKLK